MLFRWWLLLIGPALSAQTGTLSTIAGTERLFSGDGGPAALAGLVLANLQNECDPARFEEMSHISVDRNGAIYLADTGAERIRVIRPDGVISTFAGSGQRPSTDQCVPLGGAAAAGDGGQARAAKLYGPSHRP